MVQQKDQLPDQLWEMANALLNASSRISVTILRLYASVRINTIPFSH